MSEAQSAALQSRPDRNLGRSLARACATAVWLPLLTAGLVLGLALFSPVNQGGADAHFSLIVSQAILEHGTVRLDPYEAAIPDQFAYYGAHGRAQIYPLNGHVYYRYPHGSSFYGLPFVWGARTFWGKDMLVVADNHQTQNHISAVLCALIFLILYDIGRSYLRWTASLAIATITVLGSALISSLGAALWSHDFAVLFQLLALWLIARFDSGRSASVHPYWLGGLLFGAYLARPTAAVFIAVILVYLALRHRPAFWRAALSALALLIVYLLWNWTEFGRPLTAYYDVTAWVKPTAVLEALYGLLLSPSRGLLVFSPFFALLVPGVMLFWDRLKTQPLFWLALAWFGLHVALVASTDNWWGGYSYGPRLLVDAIPALVVVTILVWRAAGERGSRAARQTGAASYLALGTVALLVNSGAGLFNVQTLRWNGALPPDVDRHTAYLFDWRYPQFLATAQGICDRNAEFMAAIVARDRTLRPYRWATAIGAGADGRVDWQATPEVAGPTGEPGASSLVSGGQLFLPAVAAPANDALFIGWGPVEAELRRSDCPMARIAVRLGPLPAAGSYEVQIAAASAVRQDVPLLVNGAEVARLPFGEATTGPQSFLVHVSAVQLKPEAINEIAFQAPGLTSADSPEALARRIDFYELRLRPAR